MSSNDTAQKILQTQHDHTRVAYVVYAFDMGGLERCVAHLANRLDRSRFGAMVICLSRSGSAAEWIERDDVQIIALRKRPGNDLGVIRRLARTLREHRVDVVHSHNWGTLMETALARRWAKTPVHVHAERGMELDALEAPAWRRRLRNLATRWALDRSDCVVTNAEAIRRHLFARCGRLRTAIEVVPNGVLTPASAGAAPCRSSLRESLGIPADVALLGSVGRLAPVKDFGTAIDAVARLGRGGHDVHLVLVGDGPERESLAARAREQGVGERVHLVGQRKDVTDWLAAFDVYVNSSLNEGMSQSILEAMAAGLPLVVTDVGDSAALVNGDCPCGLVVPLRDPTATAQAVAELLAQPQRRKKFTENARARHSTQYNTGRMIRAYEALYLTLLDLDKR
ncbi:MAG: glycosyltransferase [Planctomycetota bacterium]